MKTRKFSKIAFMALALLVIVSAPCFSSTETGYMVASIRGTGKSICQVMVTNVFNAQVLVSGWDWYRPNDVLPQIIDFLKAEFPDFEFSYDILVSKVFDTRDKAENECRKQKAEWNSKDCGTFGQKYHVTALKDDQFKYLKK
jgi:hypothetical protein